MRRWMVWWILPWLCVLVFGNVIAQDKPQVIQPEASGFSAAQLAALDDAMQELGRVLRNRDLGSRHRLGEDGWSAEDFALFTAGSLEQEGYHVAVVRRGAGSAPGQTWVLAELSVLGDAVVWIPVEPLPDPALPQETLGTIPLEGDGDVLRFGPQYAAYDDVVRVPPNTAPIAVIRPRTGVFVDESNVYMGISSYDPDGVIVLFEWRFDGQRSDVMVIPSIWHKFVTVGDHEIQLTVTDNRGARGTTTMTVRARNHSEGCGCG